MNIALGAALIFTSVVATSGCKPMKEGLRSFMEEDDETLTQAETLSADGLPTYSTFQSIEPRTFYSQTSRLDQLTVVEFYSDT